MTAVFRRDVAMAAEPFPMARRRYVLHDYWTALVASLLGDVRFIDEPLVDYAQHCDNVIGARPWQGRAPRGGSTRSSNAYLRKCYREFLWRRRTLDTLRQMFVRTPGAGERLSAGPVHALFDCDSGRVSALGLSLAYRLRGEWRQADQIWRIWRGKSIYCSSGRLRR
jgi:hypothetical protein